VFAYWDRGLGLGLPSRPFCANHPESPGREREIPYGKVCRNYRLKPKTPEPSDETVKRIPITGGLTAYVDAADYEAISRYNWRLVSGGYAGRYERGKYVLMHRQIMKPPKGKVVDHIHGNRMDNTRANLRLCTPAENSRNQLKHRGSASQYFGFYYKRKDK
jgi:hypothetical protein